MPAAASTGSTAASEKGTPASHSQHHWQHVFLQCHDASPAMKSSAVCPTIVRHLSTEKRTGYVELCWDACKCRFCQNNASLYMPVPNMPKIVPTLWQALVVSNLTEAGAGPYHTCLCLYAQCLLTCKLHNLNPLVE